MEKKKLDNMVLEKREANSSEEEIRPSRKIYLTGKLHYPGVVRKIKSKEGEEIIDGEILASEPDKNGMRWLGLYDIICMFTGKTINTVKSDFSKKTGVWTVGKV